MGLFTRGSIHILQQSIGGLAPLCRQQGNGRLSDIGFISTSRMAHRNMNGVTMLGGAAGLNQGRAMVLCRPRVLRPPTSPCWGRAVWRGDHR